MHFQRSDWNSLASVCRSIGRDAEQFGNALSTLGNARAARRGWRRRSAPFGRAAGMDSRAGAAPMGEDAEQSRQRASDARGTRERHGAAGGGGHGLSRRCRKGRASGCRSTGRRRRTTSATRFEARGTRERHGAAGGGGERLLRRAAGIDARAGAARLGGDAEQLGNALGRSGERERGTARLEEAVTAFRDALKERTRERVPLDWAVTQNNLGIALGRSENAKRHGAAGRGRDRLRDALQEWTRERMPLHWATTQTNLGIVLSALGERESGTARLEEAVIPFVTRCRNGPKSTRRITIRWRNVISK